MVNGADSSALLDEEAERRAFQDAVMEWRRNGQSNEKGKVVSISSSGQSDMWCNPFSGGVSTGVGVGVDGEESGLLSARSERNVISRGRPPTGRNLAEGTIDEEKEQAVGRCII
jgi:hypothetical protein